MRKVLEERPSFLTILGSTSIWELIRDGQWQARKEMVRRTIMMLSLGRDLHIIFDGNKCLRLPLLSASEIILSFVEANPRIADADGTHVVLNEADRTTQLSGEELVSLASLLLLGREGAWRGFDRCHDGTRMRWSRTTVLEQMSQSTIECRLEVVSNSLDSA